MRRAAFACLLLVAACESRSARIGERMTYFRDQRTGLCFAQCTVAATLFTWVPCDAVAAYLEPEAPR